MSVPVVSILMPVGPDRAFLRDAAESVRSQTLAELELIVIDDAGRVEESARLSGAGGDARVRVIGNTGKGICDALNLGIAAARENSLPAATPTTAIHRTGSPGMSRFSRRTASSAPSAAAFMPSATRADSSPISMPVSPQWKSPANCSRARRAAACGRLRFVGSWFRPRRVSPIFRHRGGHRFFPSAG